jgi:hypothetical protein
LDTTAMSRNRKMMEGLSFLSRPALCFMTSPCLSSGRSGFVMSMRRTPSLERRLRKTNELCSSSHACRTSSSSGFACSSSVDTLELHAPVCCCCCGGGWEDNDTVEITEASPLDEFDETEWSSDWSEPVDEDADRIVAMGGVDEPDDDEDEEKLEEAEAAALPPLLRRPILGECGG